jgi:DNA-binding MarR family transcriptional regulator
MDQNPAEPGPDAPSLPPRRRAQTLQVVAQLGRLGTRMSGAIARQVGDDPAVRSLPATVLADLELNGPLRPVDIQEATGLTSGGVTKLLDRLEASGIIERSHGKVPGDRRAILVTLTAEGRRINGIFALAVLDECDDVRQTLSRLVTILTDV